MAVAVRAAGSHQHIAVLNRTLVTTNSSTISRLKSYVALVPLWSPMNCRKDYRNPPTLQPGTALLLP